MTNASTTPAFEGYNLVHSRFDDPDKVFDLDAYRGDKRENLAIEVLNYASSHFNEALASAERNGIRPVHVNLRWINIPDAFDNPDCTRARIVCVVKGVDKDCPVSVSKLLLEQ